MSFNEQQNSNEFSNCLILKVSLGDDTRKFPIANDDITYDELLIMMQRIFKGRLQASDDVTIKYRDDDDDLITIRDSSDLSFAVACNRLLKLILYVNEKPVPLETDEVKYIKKQLKQMRDLSNDLLDRLELHATSGNLVNGEIDLEEATIKEESLKEAAPQPPTGAQPKQPPAVPGQQINLDRSYEFDPLHQKSQQQHRLETEGGEEKHQLHGSNRQQKMEISQLPHLQNATLLQQNLDGSKSSINDSSESAQQLAGLGLAGHRESRPDTPSSIDSYKERAGSQKPLENVQLQQHQQQQHDVAMIQPSLHQQINATPLAQMSNLNGPAPGAPAHHHSQQLSYGGSVAPPPPPNQQLHQQPMPSPYQPRPTVAHAPHQQQQQQQQQYFAGPPQQMAPVYQPPQQPHSQQPAYAPPPGTQQQQHGSYPGYQQLHQSALAPPTSGYGVASPTASQYSSAPPPPPPSTNQQQAMPPPPPSSSSIGPPPMMGGVSTGMGGANPFARHSQSPYIRPATFTGAGQY